MRFLFSIIFGFLCSYLFSYIYSWVGRPHPIIIVPIFLFLITCAWTGKYHYLKHYGETAEGVIVGASTQNGVPVDSNGPKWVRFKPIKGEEQSASVPIPVFYTEGEMLEVYYDKNNPMDHYANTHFNSWIFFVLGLGLVIASWRALRLPPKEPQYADTAVHYDAPKEPQKDGCISNGLKVLAFLITLQAFMTTYQYYRLFWTGEKVTAKVVTAQKPDLNPPHPTQGKIIYAPTNQAKPLFFSNIKSEDYEIGQELEVLYNPEEPKDSIVNDPLNAYGWILIAIFLNLYAWGPGIIRRTAYKIYHKYK